MKLLVSKSNNRAHNDYLQGVNVSTVSFVSNETLLRRVEVKKKKLGERKRKVFLNYPQ
jgi:hypothetical protein